jgi:hypothetical protein
MTSPKTPKTPKQYPTISQDPKVQEHYVLCRKNGCTHKLAEMLASKKPPQVRNTYSPLHPRRNRGRGY